MKKEIVSEIGRDWQLKFRELGTFSQWKFFKVLGPLLVGIELIRLRGEEMYQPHFVIYPLWNNDEGKSLSHCLGAPTVLLAIRHPKGMSFSVSFLHHKRYFDELVDCTKTQIPIPINSDVKLNELFNAIDSYLVDRTVKSNGPGKQANLLEFLLYCSFYVGEDERVKSTLARIINESKTWNMEYFNAWHGDFSMWFQKVNKNIEERDQFMKIIERNKSHKKLQKIPMSALLP